MSSDRLEAGKQWIKNKLYELAKELEVTLDSVAWRSIADDSANMKWSLVCEISGAEHVKKFPRLDLDFSSTDPEVQARIENRLRKLLESFSPRPRRIGF